MPYTANMTIMFTDVVGSTELLDRLGDELAGGLLRRHFATLRAVAARHGGREVKSLGDGLMLAFTDARSAAACAAAMQRDLVGKPSDRPNAHRLQMRIGIDAGSVLCDGDDYFGKHVVIAKRLCDSCTAGQVLVSAGVRDELCEQSAPCTDRGPLVMRGITEPVRAAELRWQLAAIATAASKRILVSA